jgi:hypothetical protein
MDQGGRAAAPLSRTSVRSRRSRRSRRQTGAALVLAALALLVLRTPLGVLSALADVFGAPVTDGELFPSHEPGFEREPSGNDTPGASVASGASAQSSRGPGGIGDEGDVAGYPREGRWGAPPVRPATGAILLEEWRAGWRVEPGVEEAAALAVIAAHAWADARAMHAGGSGSVGAGALGTIVTVEAVERPGALHAVVTLLVADADELHRIAVPVLLGTMGPRLAGPAWSLPAPRSDAIDLRGTPTGDTDLLDAARRALEGIGIPGERLVALEVTDGWPFIARLDGHGAGHPWLRWHLDRFVVAGLPLNAGGQEYRLATPEGGGR